MDCQNHFQKFSYLISLDFITYSLDFITYSIKYIKDKKDLG